MNQILSHQHICVPVWTKDDRNERNLWAPDMLVHVQVTVIRMRYRSVLNDPEDQRDRIRQPERLSRLPEADAQRTATKKKPAATYRRTPRLPVQKAARRPIIDDPRVNDPKFREKYMHN